MLKDTKTDFVELPNEIVYLENYLSLEGLRLKNENFFNYTISGSCNGYKIAPMILIPFVENAFKHSVDSSIENGIIVKIAIENNKLIFNCENQYDQSETDKDKTHGIGLETVKRRLDLIYKNKYKLIINSDNSVYKVKLELELNEN
jgi:LytS/YehU family sensor histidine kinase